ncbi:hypothetical protein C4K88_04470 [Arthrobacter pityocampae]|uniref:Uncharacterized protein n=1 Tax=Arthrobacter pityocampae TaxID=547334 RepID=A0A2S5IZF0_9MICC|nr:hypothetical protein [Arthrobacter pityocampae]PPB49948.1 hypothetical protein C4K88_04470 [Arthrobacter pityocampae]
MTNISSIWTRIDPGVQQWVLENPGCVVLPRTLVNRVEATIGESLHADAHGEYWFSGEELIFLKARRRAQELGGYTAAGQGDRRFHDHAEMLDR